MLDPSEKSIFDDMVTHLRANDPRYVRRVNRLSAPRRRLRTACAVLLWIAVPFSIGIGGWTGFFMGVVGAAYGLRLYLRRTGLAGGSGFSWGSSPRRHPGASL